MIEEGSRSPAHAENAQRQLERLEQGGIMNITKEPRLKFHEASGRFRPHIGRVFVVTCSPGLSSPGKDAYRP